MDLGTQIKRDRCPEKYYAKGSTFKDSIPTLIAILVVVLFSGNLFNAGGLATALTIVIELIFMGGMYGMMYLMLNGARKRLAQTYISVCESGVCGICQGKGNKNREFSLSYADIQKVTAKGERLVITSGKGNVVLTLNDAEETAKLINSKLGK